MAPDETIFDLCVVGAGPVGLALALESADRGLRVALIDAGTDADNPPASEASDAENLNPRNHVGMDLTVRRGIGGTSWLWGGRCVPFDPIDFAARDYVPLSGWPIDHDDVAASYAKAVDYLDCGDTAFAAPAPVWPETTGVVVTERLEHFAKVPQRARAYRDAVASHPKIALFLGAPVTALKFSPDLARIEGVFIGTGGERLVRGRRVALACGGLETTRLMLIAQRAHPELFGGVGGPLGRYYMGHIEGVVANITFTNPRDIEAFDYRIEGRGAYVRRILTLSETAQRDEGVMNIAFWPDNRPYYDARHRSGIKSLVYLLAMTPRVGTRLVSEAIRLGLIGPAPHRIAPHVLNVLTHPIDTLDGVLGILRDRYSDKPRRPGWLPPAPDSTYVLHFRGEQRPNPDSRVTLSEDRDAFGMSRLTIDFRFLREDAQSTLRAHDLLDASLRAHGKGRVDYVCPREEVVDRILAHAVDGYHQLGTARMGTDPRTSVVGADCRVHGMANLYLATSAVFPTASHANPTLLATALAVRLAEALAKDELQRDAFVAARAA